MTRVEGIPTKPVLSIPVLRVVGDHATFYESRTYTNNGVLVMSKQRAPESAVNRTIRPGADIIEVGQYQPGDNYDLVNRIYSPDDKLVHNGKEINVGNKVDYIRRVVKSKRVDKIATHEQHTSLPDIADATGVEYRENIDKYEELGTKSGLNIALQEHNDKHGGILTPFGTNFFTVDEAKNEVARLKSFGFGAYIKTDFADTESVAAGGEGHLAIPLDTRVSEANHQIEGLFSGQNHDRRSGVVQMYIPKPKIFAISSGEYGHGHIIYEAHIQSVDGSTADGANPLDRTRESRDLLNNFWPEVKRFYHEKGITGDANLNCLVIPDEMLPKAREIYNNPDLSNIAFIDFNYRSISGTKNAMSRYQEDTGKTVAQDNFISSGIRVNRFYAANPHLIYVKAQELGLHSGHNGNMAVINMGTFNPPDFNYKETYKTQVFINDTRNPKGDLDDLQKLVETYPSDAALRFFRAQGYDCLDVDSIAMANQTEYANTLMRNMDLYLSRIKKHFWQ